jgi:hypothetical protein
MNAMPWRHPLWVGIDDGAARRDERRREQGAGRMNL